MIPRIVLMIPFRPHHATCFSDRCLQQDEPGDERVESKKVSTRPLSPTYQAIYLQVDIIRMGLYYGAYRGNRLCSMRNPPANRVMYTGTKAHAISPRDPPPRRI